MDCIFSNLSEKGIPWKSLGNTASEIETAESSLLSLFMRDKGRCNMPHVRVSVTCQRMFVNIIFSSVWVAEWPPFAKELPARLTIHVFFYYL